MAYDPRKWFSYSNLYEYNQTENSSYSHPYTSTKVSSDNRNSTNHDDDFKITSHHDDTIDTGSQHTQNFNYDISEKNYYLSSEGKYSENNSSLHQDQNGYDPCSPAIESFQCAPPQAEVSSLPASNKVLRDPRKLDHYISLLQKLIRPLSPDYKKHLSYDVICQLAHSVLDGTVFEIAKGLRDIQIITEKNLSDQRSKLIIEHRNKKNDINKRHQNEILKYKSRPHQLAIVQKAHSEEKRGVKHHCEKELLQLDQKLVLEIDQKVSDQQITLERAGLPLFFITNNAEEVKLQMYVLEFIMKLAAS